MLTSEKSSLKVWVKGGYLELLEIQFPSKRKMDIKSLLNGFDFHPEAKLL